LRALDFEKKMLYIAFQFKISDQAIAPMVERWGWAVMQQARACGTEQWVPQVFLCPAGPKTPTQGANAPWKTATCPIFKASAA
jgi:hypothetical protein